MSEVLKMVSGVKLSELHLELLTRELEHDSEGNCYYLEMMVLLIGQQKVANFVSKMDDFYGISGLKKFENSLC